MAEYTTLLLKYHVFYPIFRDAFAGVRGSGSCRTLSGGAEI